MAGDNGADVGAGENADTPRRSSEGEFINLLFHENEESRRLLEISKLQMDPKMKQMQDLTVQIRQNVTVTDDVVGAGTAAVDSAPSNQRIGVPDNPLLPAGQRQPPELNVGSTSIYAQ